MFRIHNCGIVDDLNPLILPFVSPKQASFIEQLTPIPFSLMLDPWETHLATFSGLRPSVNRTGVLLAWRVWRDLEVCSTLPCQEGNIDRQVTLHAY